MQFRKICFLCCLAIVFIACLQNNNKGDYYNLDFQRNLTDGWLDELDLGRVYYDSTTFVDGRNPLCIDNEYIKKRNRVRRRATLYYSLGRSISLPESENVEDIEVSLDYKSMNLVHSWLVVHAADKDGKLLDVYSTKIENAEEWATAKINFSSNQVQHLYVSFYTASHALTQKMNDLIVEKNIHLDSTWMYYPIQKMWINKVGVKVGDLDMKDFSPNMIAKPKIKKETLIPLDLNEKNTFTQIDALKGKKIIGIGETAHSTRESPAIAYALAKDRILHHNCRLVVLELPFSMALTLNLFINRETSYNIKEIEEPLKASLIPLDELTEFLLWLKNYNKTAERKVNIVGMGIDGFVVNEDLEVFLNEYVLTDPLLFTPIYTDVSNQEYLEAWKKILKDRVHFDRVLGKGETNLLMHALRNPAPILEAGVEKKFIFTERDSLMYNRAKIAIDNLIQKEETAVVYGHLMHTTKSEGWMTRFVPSVGKYLSDNFGDDYFSIGLMTYSEEMESIPNDKKVDDIEVFWKTKMAFQPAPPYSLEAACEKTGVSLFYQSVSDLPSTVSFRHNGSDIFKGEFNYYPTKGMDAFIFVNRVHKKRFEFSLINPNTH